MTTNHITRAMANPEIIAELGRRFKEYRLTYRFTQKEAAEKAGVSLISLRQFENGKAYNINMGNFLALLRVVDCLEQMDDLLPEMPVSAYTMEQIMNKKPKTHLSHRAYYTIYFLNINEMNSILSLSDSDRITGVSRH